ncbi:MAG: COX15/CtaA family protein [Rhodospirillaceae bacterium]|nr:COX15/CtaA family protein [Rhodospirillaceae bacterium]
MTGFSSYRRPPNTRRIKIMSAWLFSVAAMVFVMIVIGGLTRLTHSGLSMVEWKLFTGWIPPLSETDWELLFSKYQNFPEFHKKNPDMTVDGFKSIFWLEFIHRFWGRLIGLAFFIPYALFLTRSWFRPGDALFWKLTGLFALGGAQGLMGWFMVISGMVDHPDVSQYRLTAHFALALLIIAALLWVGLSLIKPEPQSDTHQDIGWLGGVKVWMFLLISLTAVSGGFVAGTDAGFVFNTFPLMDGEIIPGGLYDLSPFWKSAFEDITTIQFNHRVLAESVLVVVTVFWFFSRRMHLAPTTRLAINWLGFATIAQVMLGITTLLLVVPVWAASLHQAGAVVVFSACLWAVFEMRGSRG